MTRCGGTEKEREAARAVTVSRKLSVYRVFWIFALGSVLGDFVEVIFILLTKGELMSRSSLLYGPFSLVWGIGAELMTLVFYHLEDEDSPPVFLLGAVLGGVYEYVCSWFQEWAFGACFWDYSHLPFNLNGRINLLFCAFWGAAAVLWVRWVYPLLCRVIEGFPRKAGRWLAGVMAVFLLADAALSAAALCRMDERRAGEPAGSAVEVFLDEHYPDAFLRDRYRNMQAVE